jgi:hypothetical protein
MLTFNEWADQVRADLPAFAIIADNYSLFLNKEAAERLLEIGEYQTVLVMLQGVCEGLRAFPAAFIEMSHICGVCEKYPHEESH